MTEEEFNQTKEQYFNVLDKIDELMGHHPDEIDYQAINALDIKKNELNKKLQSYTYNTVIHSNDPVAHPQHYTYGSIECIDYLDAIGIGESFCRGSAIKYLTRLGHKNDDLEDAKKATWYCQHIADKIADGTYKRGE